MEDYKKRIWPYEIAQMSMTLSEFKDQFYKKLCYCRGTIAEGPCDEGQILQLQNIPF